MKTHKHSNACRHLTILRSSHVLSLNCHCVLLPVLPLTQRCGAQRNVSTFIVKCNSSYGTLVNSPDNRKIQDLENFILKIKGEII